MPEVKSKLNIDMPNLADGCESNLPYQMMNIPCLAEIYPPGAVFFGHTFCFCEGGVI